jgi:hypothetical protein
LHCHPFADDLIPASHQNQPSRDPNEELSLWPWDLHPYSAISSKHMISHLPARLNSFITSTPYRYRSYTYTYYVAYNYNSISLFQSSITFSLASLKTCPNAWLHAHIGHLITIRAPVWGLQHRVLTPSLREDNPHPWCHCRTKEEKTRSRQMTRLQRRYTFHEFVINCDKLVEHCGWLICSKKETFKYFCVETVLLGI